MQNVKIKSLFVVYETIVLLNLLSSPWYENFSWIDGLTIFGMMVHVSGMFHDIYYIKRETGKHITIFHSSLLHVSLKPTLILICRLYPLHHKTRLCFIFGVSLTPTLSTFQVVQFSFFCVVIMELSILP